MRRQLKELHKQKRQQTSTKSLLGICCFAILIFKKGLKIGMKYVKINIVYAEERHNYEYYGKTTEESCKGICGVMERQRLRKRTVTEILDRLAAKCLWS